MSNIAHIVPWCRTATLNWHECLLLDICQHGLRTDIYPTNFKHPPTHPPTQQCKWVDDLKWICGILLSCGQEWKTSQLTFYSEHGAQMRSQSIQRRPWTGSSHSYQQRSWSRARSTRRFSLRIIQPVLSPILHTSVDPKLRWHSFIIYLYSRRIRWCQSLCHFKGETLALSIIFVFNPKFLTSGTPLAF